MNPVAGPFYGKAPWPCCLSIHRPCRSFRVAVHEGVAWSRQHAAPSLLRKRRLPNPARVHFAQTSVDSSEYLFRAAPADGIVLPLQHLVKIPAAP